MDTYTTNLADWLEKQIQRAAAEDPQLSLLKDRINQVTESMRVAQKSDASKLLREQEKAIYDLITHITNKQKN